MIRWFIARYGVNMSEAANPDPASYRTFNEFFARPLRSGARPIAPTAWVCPVDGAVSQAGPIRAGEVFQAKGHRYSTSALLAGDHEKAQRFANGHFATIYLSPKDYHRLHMPCDGRLEEVVYVPGDLYSVNPATVRGVPGLFARNERVICYFKSPTKDPHSFAMILVGATIVGSIATVWNGVVNADRTHRQPVKLPLAPQVHSLNMSKGQEMGRFLLGSTVILLSDLTTDPWPILSAGSDPETSANSRGRPVRLGQAV